VNDVTILHLTQVNRYWIKPLCVFVFIIFTRTVTSKLSAVNNCLSVGNPLHVNELGGLARPDS
jgi:hypothetical protein